MSPPVRDTEANSPLAEVPIEESVRVSVPALMITVCKLPVAASRGERVMAPLPLPPELIVRFVPLPRVIAAAANEIGVLLLVSVVVLPLVKFTLGAV